MPHASKLLIFPLLIILTLIAYIPAFNAGFVYDDSVLIENNRYIRDLKNIPLFFISKDARVAKEFSRLQDDIYRPLQSISYALSYYVWGLDARFFHIENVVIHIINGLMVWLLLLLLFENRLLAFLSSLLFLIHPVQVEAVTYLAGRADVLFLFFLLLSFLTYIRMGYFDKRRKFFLKLASLLLFSASLLSKEMAATLPFIIVLYLIFFKPDKENFSGIEIFKRVWPYFLILGIFFLIRTINLGRVAQEGSRDPISVCLIAGRVFTEYIRLIFLPVGLTLFPDIGIENLRIGASYLGYMAVIAAYICVCAASAKRNKQVAFLLVSYLIALLPVSNIVPIKTYIQERFLYFPSVFILTSISYAAVRLWDSLDKRGGRMPKVISSSLMAAIIAALMLVTFSRNLDWKDRKALMEKEMAIHPEDGAPYFDIGAIYFQEKKYASAETYFKKALEKKRIYPIHKTMAHNLLGDIYRMRDDDDAAIQYYLKALDTTPMYIHSLNSLGDLYFKRDDYEKARDCFLKAVEVWPDSAIFNSNLGTAHILLGDTENALKYWKRSLEINPNQPQIKAYIAKNE